MNEAAVWYESQQFDLGKRFLASIQDAVNRVALNPHLYPIVAEDVRRCVTRTFPYGVLFREQPDRIVVLAVMHLRREPGYWRARGG